MPVRSRRPILLLRLLLSRGLMLIGVLASAALIALAGVLPQIPRQRAISLVEARGGSIQYEATFPGWVTELFGVGAERFQPVSQINLDGTGVGDRMMPWLVHLDEAGVVWLNSARITDHGALRLLEFASITSLDVGATALTQRSFVPLLERHQELDTLWAQDTSFGDESLRALCTASSLTNLWIPRTEVTDAGLAYLAGHPNLTALDLDHTQVGDAGIAHLAGCTSLSQLSLAHTRVEGPGLEHLARLPSLDTLNLNGTPVGDAGLRHLSRSTSLQALSLDDTKVTDAGLAHLAGIPSLRSLSLHGVQMTDAGLEHLHGASGLTDLSFDSQQVSAAALRRFAEALPHCSVNASGGFY